VHLFPHSLWDPPHLFPQIPILHTCSLIYSDTLLLTCSHIHMPDQPKNSAAEEKIRPQTTCFFYKRLI
jgi:hypothetical protein